MYSVSTWYRSTEGGSVGVAFYDSAAALAQPALQSPTVELRQRAGKEAEVLAHNGASTSGVFPHHGPPPDSDWNQIGFDFQVPPGVTAVRVFVGWGGKCLMHVDDVALERAR